MMSIDDFMTTEQQASYWRNSAKGYAAEAERVSVWAKAFIDALIEAEADRDRAREIAVALEQENARLTAELEAMRAAEAYDAEQAAAFIADNAPEPF